MTGSIEIHCIVAAHCTSSRVVPRAPRSADWRPSRPLCRSLCWPPTLAHPGRVEPGQLLLGGAGGCRLAPLPVPGRIRLSLTKKGSSSSSSSFSWTFYSFASCQPSVGGDTGGIFHLSLGSVLLVLLVLHISCLSLCWMLFLRVLVFVHKAIRDWARPQGTPVDVARLGGLVPILYILFTLLLIFS